MLNAHEILLITGTKKWKYLKELSRQTEFLINNTEFFIIRTGFLINN